MAHIRGHAASLMGARLTIALLPLVAAIALALRHDRLRVLAPIRRERPADVGDILELAPFITPDEAAVRFGVDALALLWHGMTSF
jgi:hypothetical protein